MEWLVIVGAILFVAFIAALFQANALEKKQKEMGDRLGQIENFTPTQMYMGADGKSGIAIDEERKKVALLSLRNVNQVNPESDHVVIRLIKYEDLLSSEIFEDGIAVTKTLRTSQIGGAILGGIALGGVGAIIGGLSGKTQSAPGKVRRLDLRITVNDTKSPLHDVCFLDSKDAPISKSGTAYPVFEKLIRHWHGLCTALIKQADKLTSNSDPVPQSNLDLRSSITEELKNLAQLRADGAISEEEFLEIKRRLLA